MDVLWIDLKAAKAKIEGSGKDGIWGYAPRSFSGPRPFRVEKRGILEDIP